MVTRPCLFRLVAVLLGLLVPLAVEFGCRWAGWGKLTEAEDPYVGFDSTRSLFELNRTSGQYEIPVSRQALFCEESFARTKGSHEYRIFCLGGSTVQGRPYAVETSFTAWLEVSLEAADPSRDWQVVNCGGVSYASYRLLPILRELLTYEADLLIVYTGHNEFLEDRTYQSVKRTPAFVAAAHSGFTSLRSYNVLRSAWLHISGQLSRRSQLALDAEPRLDYRGGLLEYSRDDAWRQTTIEHFRFCLQQMVGIARDAGIPVVLCNPVSDLKDTPPFKTEPSPGLAPALAEQIRRRMNAAQQAPDPHRQLELMDGILVDDPRNAHAHYVQGRCQLTLGRADLAESAFLRAKDEDICPLRMLEPMHRMVIETAAQFQVPLADIRQSFERCSPHSIPGKEWLVDHVHPTIAGHQRIAEELFCELQRMGIIRPRPGWQQQRDRRYKAHRSRLSADYFAAAQVRMEGLGRWTSGRAFQVKPR